MKNSILPKLNAITSAILFSLSFIVPGAGPLIFIAFIPLLYKLSQTSTFRSFLLQTLLFAVLTNAIVAHFSYFAFQNTFHLNPIATTFGTLVFFVFNEFQFFVFFGAFWWAKRRYPRTNWSMNFALAALYVSTEFFIPKLFADTLALALYDQIRLRQVADLGGAHLLTFVIVLTSLFIADAVAKRKIRFLVPPLVAFAVCFTYGHVRTKQIESTMQSDSRVINFGVIQSNIPEDLKTRAFQRNVDADKEVVARQTELTRQFVNQYPATDIIVWSESAYPLPYNNHDGGEYDKLDAKLTDLIKSTQKHLVFGGMTVNKKTSQIYNSIQSLSPTGGIQTYRKMILMPLGEYVPGAELLRGLTQQVLPNYQSGSSLKNLDVIMTGGTISLIPVLCYEALFPSHAARGAKQGGQMIVDLADDTIFESALEAKLHLHAAAFTSVATRLSQVRATNSGYSAWIDPLGTIHEPSDLNQVELRNYAVNISHLGKTFFTQISASIAEIWFGLFILLGAGAFLEAAARIRCRLNDRRTDT